MQVNLFVPYDYCVLNASYSSRTTAKGYLVLGNKVTRSQSTLLTLRLFGLLSQQTKPPPILNFSLLFTFTQIIISSHRNILQ